MKVYGIQKNNYNKSFKALRFNKGSEKFIAQMPSKALNKIEKVKNELADTEFYHLEIGSDCIYMKDNNGERLYQPFLLVQAGKVLVIKAKQGLTQISKKLKYNSIKEVNEICDRIKQTTTQFERSAEIVKTLDEYEKRIKLNTSK